MCIRSYKARMEKTGMVCTVRCPVDLISNWMGGQYRIVDTEHWGELMERQAFPAMPPFLNRAVYGDEPGVKEERLILRYQDYEWVQPYVKMSPFGMGENWDEIAVQAYLTGALELTNEDLEEWEEHWEWTRVHREMLQDRMLEGVQ